MFDFYVCSKNSPPKDLAKQREEEWWWLEDGQDLDEFDTLDVHWRVREALAPLDVETAAKSAETAEKRRAAEEALVYHLNTSRNHSQLETTVTIVVRKVALRVSCPLPLSEC
jgi:hypothetical protein